MWRAVVIDHAESEADRQQKGRKVVEVKEVLAARGRQRGLHAVPDDENRREHSKKVLSHRVEEAEILSEEIVDRLKDELEIVGLHGCGSLDAAGSFPLRHLKALKRTRQRARDLGHVACEVCAPLDVGIDGVGRGLALLLGNDGLLFKKRGEEFVRVLKRA